MKKYLEYKDDKSAKFWKIEVRDLAHTATYGKIGTEGQQKTKTFDSVEAVTEAVEKLIKAKLKKGYQEVTEIKAPSIKARFLEQEQAEQQFNLDDYAPLPSWTYDAVLLIEGDVVLESELNDKSINKHLFNNKRTTKEELIIIDGNLTIEGDLSIYGETGYPSLLILGELRCDSLYSYDNFIHISKDAYVHYGYYGHYNHGAIKVGGVLHVPYLVNGGHHSDLIPSEQTIVINSTGRYDDFFSYHYYEDELPQVLLKEVLYLNGESYEFDRVRFAEFVEQGKYPFREGAKPGRELIVDKLEQMAVENTIKNLDLTDKRLFELPAALFKLTNLEILVVENNEIIALPEAIGQLTDLKVLNLRKTNITEVPTSIGQLKQLEVLNLAHCSKLTHLPESIGQLKQLTTLNLSQCYQLKALPESIGQLKNLKKLMLWNFKGTVPDSIFELPQIEALEILI